MRREAIGTTTRPARRGAPRGVGRRARRAALVAATAVATLVLAPAAGAHPLGNFSVNHLAQVTVSSDRVDVRYILDEAEIPTFQERGLSSARLLERKQAEVRRGLTLTVDGRAVELAPAGKPALSHPPGQGGLATTRLELPLVARVAGARRVELRDETFSGRVGWKAIVVRPGRGTAVRSSAPAEDPTGGLRRYPMNLLKSPSDLRVARLSVAPGTGTVVAPDGKRFADVEDRTADGGFTRIFADAAAGEGVLLLLVLAAFGWGAIHALSPGHGKAMVAAYLVGTRGTPRHAVLLGATVTVTHTAGVFALGLVALLLSQYVLPEQLYPWLNLVSGVLVVVVGASVLRSHVRRGRAMRATDTQSHDHEHHAHAHDHGDHRHGAHAHDHGDHGHGAHAHSHGARVHSHVPTERLTPRGLIALGASAGLIPCPSALVVLLGAVAQGQVVLGMLLIVVFSLGLATTLVALGLAVVLATRTVSRLPVPGRLMTALPTASALAIVMVGCVLTAQALPHLT